MATTATAATAATTTQTTRAGALPRERLPHGEERDDEQDELHEHLERAVEDGEHRGHERRRRRSRSPRRAASRRRPPGFGCALSSVMSSPFARLRRARPCPVCRRRHRATSEVPLPGRKRVSERDAWRPRAPGTTRTARRTGAPPPGRAPRAPSAAATASAATPRRRPTAANSAAPTPARDGPSRTSCASPVTSLTICGHSAPAAPPPLLRRPAMVAPASRIVSRLWRTAKAAASMSARKRCPRPCAAVRPSDRAAQVGVEQRRALAGEVRQREEAAGAGSGRGGLLVQRLVGDLAGQVAQPRGERAGRGDPGGEVERPRREADRAPQPRVRSAPGCATSMRNMLVP